jgi:hypothetical protein
MKRIMMLIVLILLAAIGAILVVVFFNKTSTNVAMLGIEKDGQFNIVCADGSLAAATASGDFKVYDKVYKSEINEIRDYLGEDTIDCSYSAKSSDQKIVFHGFVYTAGRRYDIEDLTLVDPPFDSMTEDECKEREKNIDIILFAEPNISLNEYEKKSKQDVCI